MNWSPWQRRHCCSLGPPGRHLQACWKCYCSYLSCYAHAVQIQILPLLFIAVTYCLQVTLCHWAKSLPLQILRLQSLWSWPVSNFTSQFLNLCSIAFQSLNPRSLSWILIPWKCPNSEILNSSCLLSNHLLSFLLFIPPYPLYLLTKTLWVLDLFFMVYRDPLTSLLPLLSPGPVVVNYLTRKIKTPDESYNLPNLILTFIAAAAIAWGHVTNRHFVVPTFTEFISVSICFWPVSSSHLLSGSQLISPLPTLATRLAAAAGSQHHASFHLYTYYKLALPLPKCWGARPFSPRALPHRPPAPSEVASSVLLLCFFTSNISLLQWLLPSGLQTLSCSSWPSAPSLDPACCIRGLAGYGP